MLSTCMWLLDECPLNQGDSKSTIIVGVDGNQESGLLLCCC